MLLQGREAFPSSIYMESISNSSEKIGHQVESDAHSPEVGQHRRSRGALSLMRWGIFRIVG